MWKESSGSFQDAPVGVHLARCVGIIDIGTQKSEYQGKTNIRRQCVLRWELPETLMEDGRPFVVSKFYTTSLSEKANLRADLVNWRGREFTHEELQGFDERNLLDKVCMVSITKTDNGKHRVTGIMGKPKGVEAPPRVNELAYFSLEPGAFNMTTFEGISDGLKKMIMNSPEWAEVSRGAPPTPVKAGGDDFEDDIPF